MEQLNVGLTVTGGLALVVGLLSSPLDRSWLSAPLFAFLLGVGMGRYQATDAGNSQADAGDQSDGHCAAFAAQLSLPSLALAGGAAGHRYAGHVSDQLTVDLRRAGLATTDGAHDRRRGVCYRPGRGILHYHWRGGQGESA